MKLPSQPTQSRHQISTPPTLRPMPPPPTTPLLTPLPLTQPIPAVCPKCSLPSPQTPSRKETPATSRPATETKGGHVGRGGVPGHLLVDWLQLHCTDAELYHIDVVLHLI